ncbi:hypothetical protein RJ640_027500 [Escallonia rubra]|uniref:Uncharacterized protein n=1 Tax=Escallonia rubra TaxID=112253 RepID=A0AA88RBX1_9ASTE|nr:hypothetical protein RJ640_027500 [Escallonia rubra]
MDGKSLSELVLELQASANEVNSLARASETFYDLSIFIEKLCPIFSELKDNKFIDTPPIRKAMESFATEIKRAKSSIISPNCQSSPIKHVEDVTQNLGRSLGLILFATHDVCISGKEKIEALRKDMMNAKFSSTASSDCRSDFLYDGETEEESDETEEDIIREEIEEVIVEEATAAMTTDNIVLQLKYGEDEEFKYALSGLNELIMNRTVTGDWINEEAIIPILFNRLCLSKPENRLTIIQILRSLITYDHGNKEKMAEVGSLSSLVKSLTRDADEQREAVALLLTLSDVPAVRRRIGRIQGGIVMLVAILNGDDQVASRDAGKLLHTLSSNTQNALHMAEAGYFKPLVQYLKEGNFQSSSSLVVPPIQCPGDDLNVSLSPLAGLKLRYLGLIEREPDVSVESLSSGSDMSKILMATALSRMELRDQTRATIGGDGAIEPLVKMFRVGKLEAKLSALRALQNLSSLKENTQRLISSGIVACLLQLLFSVTSVLMTLREPASAILAKIAESESTLVNHDIALQMLSLLNLCSPVIQSHLLQALNSIAAHSGASKVRRKMKENGAIQLLLPFLTERNTKIRTGALNLIYTLSKDLQEDLAEQLGETHLNIIVNILTSSASESEKAIAVGILSNLPVSDKKATDILNRANLLPILVSIMSSSQASSAPTTAWLAESIAGVFIRFTVPTDKKLQIFSAENGIIQVLVKLLSDGSSVAKCRAATSLAQLSQNSLSLSKSRKSKWLCVPPSAEGFCEVHDGYCSVKSTFCLVKSGVVSPLIQILEGNEREAEEAVLSALATLLQDEIWGNGSSCIASKGGVQALGKVLESGPVPSQKKTIWMLERIFRTEAHRVQYGESVQGVLIDLTQKGDPQLKPIIAKLLAQLELLQFQSSYF